MTPTAAGRSPLARSVWWVSGVGVLLLLAVAARYGYHRDELYFLAAGDHLAWGYVDQPPLTPLIARAIDEIAGGGVVSLRVLPALAYGGLIVTAGAMAREFGGGAIAQGLAALAAASAGQFMGSGHLLSTTPFDQLAWATTILLVIKLANGADERLWLAVGALAGVALLNKWLILFLLGALAVGLLATPTRRLLWSPWVAAGAVAALALWLPNLLWQAGHDWPALDMSRALAERFREDDGPAVFLAAQILFPGPLTLLLWAPGLVWLWRNERARPWRFLAICYIVLIVVFLVTSGKPYYPAPAYLPLYAAGAVLFERRALDRQRASRRFPALLVIGWIIAVPISLPALPPSALADVPVQEINYDLGEQIGWPALVDEIERVYRAIPPAGRADAVILTSNYGEAGAIRRFGTDLPTAYSGHNSYWWWGPPPSGAAPVVVVGYSEERLGLFEDCERKATVTNPHEVANDELGAPIWLCAAPRGSWQEIWPALRGYG